MRHASALEPLIGLVVDRDDERRGRPELFDELLADPAVRVLPLWHGRMLVEDGATLTTGAAAAWPSAREEAAAQASAALRLFTAEQVTSALTRVYLGRVVASGTPVIAVTLTDAAAGELEPDEGRWHPLRELQLALDEVDDALAVEAVAIMNWHESHTHCPRCGTPTVVERGGWVRRCFVDGREVFPRTDPAVIVRVLDAEGRILLGSNAAWEGNRWSLLAGFVEPGESFEQAAIREVFEESGVTVTAPRYLGSQPWPFPASVMIGMEARAVAADALAADGSRAAGEGAAALRPDGQEILAVRWFSREELWAEREELLLPGGASIAHAIVRDWYGGPLDEAPRGR